MSAYYNELDTYAAQWLRNLIAAGHIAPGDVDERDIRLVRPDDLRGYRQCHFFAGIGVWSYALRLAGWPDDREVWTGSCPCQPFSAAGKGEGTDDARHLWPEWFRLIAEHRPVTIFGEQVSAAIRHSWLDLVCRDLEGLDYAVGAAVMGAHSVGAPHIRQRLYFVGESNCAGSFARRETGAALGYRRSVDAASGASELADASIERRQQIGRSTSCDEEAYGRARWNGNEPDGNYVAGGDGEARGVADSQHPERWPLKWTRAR